MSHPYPALCPTFTYVGRVSYFLTFVTFDRHPLFRDAGVVDLVLSQFRRAAHEHAFGVLVYCFMPEHVHLVVHGRHNTSEKTGSSER